MLSYKVKIGLAPMRRNTTNRPAKTFLTWVSAEERGHRFVDYIEKNFSSENVSFVDSKGLGCADLIYDDKTAADFRRISSLALVRWSASRKKRLTR